MRKFLFILHVLFLIFAAGSVGAQTLEQETVAALEAARLDEPDAGAKLHALLEKYPASPYLNRVRFRAAVCDYNAGDYRAALALFDLVKPKRLTPDERAEYYFKAGHAYFAMKDHRMAQWALSRVDLGSTYAPHAEYFLAYIDYDRGYLSSAKQKFAKLESHASYSKIVPYYLLQMEFSEGNYPYVAQRAAELMPSTVGARQGELAQMAAQSRFRLEDYAGAIADLESYKNLGGQFSRAENYLMGYSLYRETVYDRAAEYLALATGADDSLSQNASYILADTYLKLGDRTRAMQSFSIAAGSGHDPMITEDALFNYGKLLYQTDSGRFNEAINVLVRYLETYPESPRADVAREFLIAAYYNSRNYEAALEAIAAHHDTDNNVKAALQKINYFRALEFYNDGDADKAMGLLETSLRYRYNAKYTALATFWQGEILYSQGNYDGAIAKYEEYIRLSPPSEPENLMARYNLGYAHFNLDRWDEAKRWFDDFIARYTPKTHYRADAFNREGDVFHAQRNYSQAIAAYNLAAEVSTEPEKFYAAYQRALMSGLGGKADQKSKELGEIIASGQGPYVEDATYELGRSDVSRGRYSAGAKTLTGFIAKYPDSRFYLPALSNLGLAYLNMGDRAMAMNYYKRVVERAPWSAEAKDAMTGIRGLYVDAGDVDGWLAYAKESGAGSAGQNSDRQRDSLNFVVAERAYLSGDGAKAIPALEKYLTQNPKGRHLATAQGYLAGLYFKAARYDDAASAYERAAEMTSDKAAKARLTENHAKSLRLADFAEANRLRSQGRDDEAVAIYRTIATDVRTPEGAESTYRVIEYLYKTKDYNTAEGAIFEFSEQNTPHTYWLGQAFLTLGDIYVRQGDTFQARATYQSIVDGYSPSDDGVIAAARQRIAQLK